MSTFARLADIPLEIESYELEPHEAKLNEEFTRFTTVIRLKGAGHEGLGEDVVYMGDDHIRHREFGPSHPLTGSWTLATFSEQLGKLDLFPGAPSSMEASADYRTWAFESAALDLALRQNGVSFPEAVGREARPVRYAVSLRLGDPPSLAPIEQRLALYPELTFKTDPQTSWTEELIADLAALGRIDSVDFKGLYKGTPVDQPADPVLYERVVRALPEAWIEDPAITPETEPILLPERERITWDAPIHSVADIEGLPFPPKMLNFKPSRFGSLERLFDAYDYCEREGISIYGGGQGELSVGRGQIQYLASVFHPDTPNDVAPSGFNLPETPADMPHSPMGPPPAEPGFRWTAG